MERRLRGEFGSELKQQRMGVFLEALQEMIKMVEAGRLSWLETNLLSHKLLASILPGNHANHAIDRK
jgi:hypothetical protein